jgi:hypothetical protein
MLGQTISEVTRRAVIDAFMLSGHDWAGRLSESEFLGRLYDLANLPSTDRRLRDAAADIRQHRENWRDWEDDWVFYDSRFSLLFGPDSQFLRFLEESIHPVVRPDVEQARGLAAEFNAHLRSDGWELIEHAELSGRPVFKASKLGQRAEVFSEPVGWPKVDRQIHTARQRLMVADNEEDYQTVGLLCREVLISLAETAYNPSTHRSLDGVEPSKSDAARMLEAYFQVELAGGANEESRAHAKAALKLAVALQHKRTASYRMAALCAEATVSVVNLVAILSGRRDLK